MVEAVFTIAYGIDDVTVVAEAAIGNWPVVMPEIAAVVLGHPVPSAKQGFCPATVNAGVEIGPSV
jgi:hypothetical protein